MAPHKLDQLFRHKLEAAEIAPKASSWEQVQGQLTQQKRAWMPVWQIAASITVLLAFGISAYLMQPSKKQFLSASDSPKRQYPLQFKASADTLSLENPKTEKSVPVVPTKDTQKPDTRKTDMKENKTEYFVPEHDQWMAVEKTEFQNLEVDLPVTFPRELTKQSSPLGEVLPTIKITYIASQSVDEPDLLMPDRLNKVVSLARQVSPADMLADLRDAKDQLFRRN